MIKTYTRTPGFQIDVVRPDYLESTSYKETAIATFGTTDSDGVSTACISYSFSDNLASLDGPFQFVTTLETDNKGQTWFDKIKTRDLVKIKEHGLTRFVGYVTSKKYISRMGDNGPERSIAISGKSIGGLLMSFSIIMDLHILTSSETATTASIKFMTQLAANVEENQKLATIITTVKDAYFDAMEESGGNQNVGVKTILEEFFDWSTQMSSSLVAQYPIVVSAFQTGQNSLWETINQLLNPPFHEIFGLWDSTTNMYQMWLRQTPFDASDWADLTYTSIPDDIPFHFVTDYDLGASDADVKTWFICTLPGSAIDQNKALTLDSYSRTSVKDTEKWPYYGYKPMIVENRYFNRSEDNQKGFSAETLMQTFANKLYDWYANNADFVTGTLTIMNVQDQTYTKYPKIGEKIKFLGGEFYIEATENSWQYGGPMKRTLTISRGYIYDSDGSQSSAISQIGVKLGVLEQESNNG